MKTALSMVKTYAWIKATSSSRQFMKIIRIKLTNEREAPMAKPNWQVMNITHVSDRIMAWPPIMLANKRTIRANGFVNMPNSSMTGIMGIGTFSHVGTSGQNISFQYSLEPKIFTISRVQTARKNVIVMLPVTLAPPGKMGSRPKRLVMKIKKKAVSRNGA